MLRFGICDFFHIFASTIKGEVLEWLKRHAWKACRRQKRLAGSNPVLSAKCKALLDKNSKAFLF